MLQKSDHHHADCQQMLTNFLRQQGDKGAALLTTLQRYIQYCGARLQPLSEADQQELLQEVCIKLLRQKKTLEHNCSGWLFTLIRHEYIDLLRRQQRLQALVSSADTDDSPELDDYPAPYRMDNLYQETDCLEQIFAHLEQQATGAQDLDIYTQYALGHSDAEIAQHTGRTQGAIAKRLSLLRQKLRELREALC